MLYDLPKRGLSGREAPKVPQNVWSGDQKSPLHFRFRVVELNLIFVLWVDEPPRFQNSVFAYLLNCGFKGILGDLLNSRTKISPISLRSWPFWYDKRAKLKFASMHDWEHLRILHFPRWMVHVNWKLCIRVHLKGYPVFHASNRLYLSSLFLR